MSDLQVQQSDSSRRNRVPIGLLPILAGLLIATAGQGATVLAADPPTPSYERNIKPILARRCVVCHSARNRDDLDLSGGLALDTYDAIMNGTGRRKVVISGRSAGSELVRRLSEPDEDLRMPLQDTPLPQPQRELIGRWIDAGAPRGVPSATTASAPTPNGVASIGRPRPGPGHGRDPPDRCEASSRDFENVQGRPDGDRVARRSAARCGLAGLPRRQPVTRRRDLWSGRNLGPGRGTAGGRDPRYSRTGARAGIQPGRPSPGDRRGSAGPFGGRPDLFRPGWLVAA